ncbi:hypothetical protein NQ314_009727 [Rhamnusium bicolor]|uniref:Uncharacterized protein n=1 Tax=Rhamnusium bicolor TaxID=1586634 RepID=A0AAV8XWL7_9CUCU|nr:hypothetical protein NQ314_009727 [Rhamnusium bicolor]
MAVKFLVFITLVTIVRGGVLVSDATYDPNPAYSFAYNVQDALTGDSKGQIESRANGVVQGQYNLAQSDGTRRIVDYVADPINGFNAVVRNAPLGVAAPFAIAPAVSRVASLYAPSSLSYAFFAVFALMITIARGEVVGARAAIVPAPVLAKVSDATYDPVPQYYFGYNVEDALTGDSKSHIESRNGDIVLGQYSLNDPDGTRRIVDYTSDSLNGFNAVVRKASLALATPVVARVAAASIIEPVVAKAAAVPLAVKAAAPPAEVKAVTSARTAAAPTVAKIAPPAVAPAAPESAPVIAKKAPVTPDAAPVVAAPLAVAPAPVAYTAPVPIAYAAPALAYAGFTAPLALSLW